LVLLQFFFIILISFFFINLFFSFVLNIIRKIFHVLGHLLFFIYHQIFNKDGFQVDLDV
jgi:hypothetical protein